MEEHHNYNYGYYHSPIGWIKIKANEQLVSLSFLEDISIEQWERKKTIDNIVIRSCVEQLKQYFEKKLRNFNLPLAIKGSSFQELVWSEAFKIPYGMTISYKELAKMINRPTAARAVGNALGKNPLALIIPCHRIVRKNNSKIVNYFWGKERKLYLQELEENFEDDVNI